MTRPRVLFLAHIPPWPAVGGGQIRTRSTLAALAPWCDIELICHVRPTETPDVPDEIRDWCRAGVRCVPLPRGRVRDLWLLIGGWCEPLPWRIARDRTDAMLRAVAGSIARADVVHADHLPMVSALPCGPPHRPVILDCHNAEHRLFAECSGSLGWPWSALAKKDARRLRGYEAEAVRRAAIVAATTEEDRTALVHVAGVPPEQVVVVPVGMPRPRIAAPRVPDAPPRMVLPGTWDWPPNVDGLRWFVDQVLPRLRRSLPTIEVEVAGRRAGAAVRRLGRVPGVRLLGPIGSIDTFLSGATVCVAPSRCGAGIRIKVLDALSRGVPVVASPGGAEGLPILRGMRVEADAEGFARAVMSWLAEPERARADGAASIDPLLAHHGTEAASAAWRVVYRRAGVPVGDDEPCAT